MSNPKAPAFPSQAKGTDGFPVSALEPGLTKHELACIELRVADTGDADLDALIRQAQRRELSAMAMQALAQTWHETSQDWTEVKQAQLAIKMSDALLAELEKEKL